MILVMNPSFGSFQVESNFVDLEQSQMMLEMAHYQSLAAIQSAMMFESMLPLLLLSSAMQDVEIEQPARYTRVAAQPQQAQNSGTFFSRILRAIFGISSPQRNVAPHRQPNYVPMQAPYTPSYPVRNEEQNLQQVIARSAQEAAQVREQQVRSANIDGKDFMANVVQNYVNREIQNYDAQLLKQKSNREMAKELEEKRNEFIENLEAFDPDLYTEILTQAAATAVQNPVDLPHVFDQPMNPHDASKGTRKEKVLELREKQKEYNQLNAKNILTDEEASTLVALQEEIGKGIREVGSSMLQGMDARESMRALEDFNRDQLPALKTKYNIA